MVKAPSPATTMSWPEFGAMCERMARDIAVSPEIDAVVGIALGGAIAGASIASLARKDYYPIRLARRAGHELQHTRRVVVPPTRDLQGRRILLVDDISQTGDTFKIARHELRQVGARAVTTLALVRKEGSFEPDHTGMLVVDTLRFPWQNAK